MPNDQIAHGCDNFMSWYEVSGGGGYVTMTSHCGSYVKEAEYRFGGAVNPYYKGAYYQRFCVDCEGKVGEELTLELITLQEVSVIIRKRGLEAVLSALTDFAIYDCDGTDFEVIEHLDAASVACGEADMRRRGDV